MPTARDPEPAIVVPYVSPNLVIIFAGKVLILVVYTSVPVVLIISKVCVHSKTTIGDARLKIQIPVLFFSINVAE